jgi:glycosyltransferase involved in cell wall biosynthesis
MRILQVIHDFVPRHVAGSELYCYYLSGALAERQHSVHAFFTEFDCSRRQYEYRCSRLGSLTCHEVVHNHVHASFVETYLNPRMDERFERLLHDERPDVVHLHHLLNHSLNYPRIARRRGIPVVFTLHDYWLTCVNYGQRLHPERGVCDDIDIALCADCVSAFPVVPPFVAPIRRAMAHARSWRARVLQHAAGDDAGSTTAAVSPRASLASVRAKSLYRKVVARLTPATARMAHAARRLEAIRAACRDVDLFLSPSEFLARKMIDFGLPADRVVWSPNGMRTDLLQIQRQRRGGGVRFGYVGSVAPHKGVHVLVEAFRTLAAQRPDRTMELRIHGNISRHPVYVARLRAMAGAAPVSFLGEFDNARANEVYSGIDALVIPSIWWENAPLTLFEAKLAGCPVMVSDCGSLPDLVDARGTVFRSGDVHDLARCLARFADRPRLVSATAPMAPAVKSIAQDAQRMEQLYERLVAAARPARDRIASGNGPA